MKPGPEEKRAIENFEKFKESSFRNFDRFCKQLDNKQKRLDSLAEHYDKEGSK